MRATADRVIVKPTKETKVGGVILPDTAMEKPMRGEVCHIGPKVREVAVGETIFYSKYGGTELEHEGDDLVVLREADILAVV